MAGEHVDAISRMDDLITDVWADPVLYVVQAREMSSYSVASLLMFPIGIYAPSLWELAYGEQQLRVRDSVV